MRAGQLAMFTVGFLAACSSTPATTGSTGGNTGSGVLDLVAGIWDRLDGHGSSSSREPLLYPR